MKFNGFGLLVGSLCLCTLSLLLIVSAAQMTEKDILNDFSQYRLLSQAVFCSALRIEEFKLNVVFVWAFAVFWLDLYENKNKINCLCSLLRSMFYFCLAVNVDYGIIGFGWVLFWYFKEKEKLKSPYDTAINDVVFYISTCKAFSLFAYPLAVYCKKHDKVRCKNRMIKYIYRWFYPAHLAFLRGLQC